MSLKARSFRSRSNLWFVKPWGRIKAREFIFGYLNPLPMARLHRFVAHELEERADFVEVIDGLLQSKEGWPLLQGLREFSAPVNREKFQLNLILHKRQSYLLLKSISSLLMYSTSTSFQRMVKYPLTLLITSL